MSVLYIRDKNGAFIPIPTISGKDGLPGKTAYQYAVEGGYEGTEAEFAAKLAQEIPEAYTLPAATADRLGGMMPGDGLTADEDGRVSVDPQKHYTKTETDAAIREALAEEGWVFVGEETVKTESILRITKDMPTSKSIMVVGTVPKGTTSDSGYVMFTNNGQNVVNGGCTIISTVAERQFRAQAYINGGVWKEDFMCGNSGESAQIYGMVSPHIIKYEKDVPTINGVAIYCFKSTGFTIDAHFEYYVREK